MDDKLERRKATDLPDRRTCPVAGCPCKDARIVSQRRAACFAAWAKEHGETADRAIEPDSTWSLALLARRRLPTVLQRAAMTRTKEPSPPIRVGC